MIVFHGFDLEDAESIRHLSVGLRFYNAGGRDFTKGPMLQSLNDLQRETIEYVVDIQMARNPLLTKIIESFIDTSSLNDNIMLAAGRRLQRYAAVDSGEPGSEEYEDMVQAWESREELPKPKGAANVGQHTAEMQRLHLKRLTAQGAEERRLKHNRARGLDAMAGIEEDDDTSDEAALDASKPKKKLTKTVRFKNPGPEPAVKGRVAHDVEFAEALQRGRYLASDGA
ncbi:hypothetical protein BDZ45DRAFT_720450 [Acephala macrosclerotiorum]|nr:hypothetical protein BDZ45DRAFT_720450 [Acephala macrosclerotiorum]